MSTAHILFLISSVQPLPDTVWNTFHPILLFFTFSILKWISSSGIVPRSLIFILIHSKVCVPHRFCRKTSVWLECIKPNPGICSGIFNMSFLGGTEGVANWQWEKDLGRFEVKLFPLPAHCFYLQFWFLVNKKKKCLHILKILIHTSYEITKNIWACITLRSHPLVFQKGDDHVSLYCIPRRPATTPCTWKYSQSEWRNDF